MANTYLTKTNSGGGSETKGTFSAWMKICNFGDDNVIFHELESSGNYFSIKLKSGDFLVDAQNNSSAFINVRTNRVLRDFSAWYHIVVAIDSTQSTAANRIKIYINGVQETSFSTATYPPVNQNCKINQNNEVQTIGGAGASEYFDGYLSHVYWVDGTAYAASTFGSTDSATGQWKINTSPSLTMGTNGFTILKDGKTITDQSANSNNFSLGGGTLTKSEDCPDNVFSTINTLYNQTTGQGVTPTFGNNLCYYGSDSSRSCLGSTSPSSGKYYYEAKVFDKTNVVLGIVNLAWGNLNGASGYSYHDDALNFGYNLNGQKTSGGSNTSFGSAINNNDIFMCAMDLDNQKLYFGLNGTWQGSGDPTSGSTGTGSAYNLAAGANYASACRLRNGTQVGFNFGNGYYSSSSQVSSAGTNASGNGIFEYDVPTGYTALSTKGLNL